MLDQCTKMSVEPYANSQQHIFSELGRLDLLIQAQIQQVRESHPADNEYQGLYISEQEVDALLSQSARLETTYNASASPLVQSIDKAAVNLRAEIDQRIAESKKLEITLLLEQIRRLFKLSSFDMDVILVCLAPELDLRYEKLYAYLQDDVTKKRPSVDLVLNLLCRSVEEKLTARQHFAFNSLLNQFCLVTLFEDPSQQQATLIGKFIKLDNRIVSYLLGSDEIDERIVPYSKYLKPKVNLDTLLLDEGLKSHLTRFLNTSMAAGKFSLFYFQGPYGVGKKDTAEAICNVLGLSVLSIDGLRLVDMQEVDFQFSLQLIVKEAMLINAAIYWTGFDELLSEKQRPRLERLFDTLKVLARPGFLVGNEVWEPANLIHGTAFYRVKFTLPDFRQRIQLWKQTLQGKALASDLDLDVLGERFQFSAGQIRDAAATASNLAHWRVPEKSIITMKDLNDGCRSQSNHKLANLAHKIVPRYSWDDIVLPPKRLQQLQEIKNAAKYSSLVYSDWGFGQKLSLGKGLNVLFTGPSGTGKTMAAEIIAAELGLDIYKIDLSIIVSKYIGETEKNLSQIFTEAQTANAILFFDEADALFGKRSEVRDSHDRYANIETGYLLQRMEEYEGIVILATNLGKNMDDAFVRRMHYNIEFPFPGESNRHRIWQGVWPDSTPVSPDLDLEFMAKHFELSGGNIKNVALAAAFRAANEAGVIQMDHLISATQSEYEKMGKVIMEGEFSPYGRFSAPK